MPKEFGGPLGAAGRDLGVKYLDDFQAMLPLKIGRGDSDAAGIGGAALVGLHRLSDAGATSAELDAWMEKAIDCVRRARAALRLCEGR
jgi:hypothetical protein